MRVLLMICVLLGASTVVLCDSPLSKTFDMFRNTIRTMMGGPLNPMVAMIDKAWDFFKLDHWKEQIIGVIETGMEFLSQQGQSEMGELLQKVKADPFASKNEYKEILEKMKKMPVEKKRDP